MKLNYKRTILVGFAFFLICAFWQAYDNTVPLILTNKFGMSQTWSGVIMAMDNVLALFLLPLFGHISDKCTHPRGRRTPFIVVGTLIAAVALIALSFADNAQLKRLDKVSAIDDPAALTVIYNEQKDATLLSPSGESFILGHKFTEAEFTAIRSQTVTPEGKTVTDPAYTNYVVPARQACARDAAAANPGALVVFVALLLIILLSMATFRSPAVALMPDVTPKPLRSKANAVINLMGSAGGIIVLALGMVFATASVSNSMMSYTGYFGVIAALMLAALVVWLIFGDQIKEAITGEKPPITDVDKPDDTIDKPDDTPVTPTISLNRTVLVLNVGEKDELKVNGTEDAAAWSSSAPTVASVNSAGEVTALTKGNAVITAEVNGESVTCTVTVKDESDAPDNGTDTPDNNSTTTKPNNSNKPSTGSVDVSKLTLESEYGTTIKPNDGTFDISLPVGLSCSFTVKGTDMTAAWSSADSSIATVSADGTVKTVSRGETTLTIKIGSTEISCTVRVTR